MGLLRLAILGTPEVFHDGTRLTFALRKAQALLIYLAVEGGMDSRNKLTALLWPDSEPRDARRSLRNALTPLRNVLSDAPASPHTHLIREGDLLGLSRQAPVELDLDVVQQAYRQVLRLSTAPPQSQGAIPTENVQRALTLVREQEPASAQDPNPRLQSLAARPSKRQLEALGDFLFAQTGGQPLYLLETLKLLCERMWLAPQPGGDGSWRLEPSMDLATTFALEHSRRELLPASVRAQVRARLAKLSPAARQVVMASAVLGRQTTAHQLWQVADVGVQAGIEALEEAVRSGILRELASGSGHPASYGFAQELMRQAVLTELGEARRQVLSQRAAGWIEREAVKLPQRAAHALSA